MMKKLLALASVALLSFSVQAAKFSEGDYYKILELPKSSSPIVTEFFSFYCPHCNSFEPMIQELSIRENDSMENSELGLAIENCLSQIPQNHARAFSLKTIEHWSTEDICKELNISPSNLWVMVHRARTALMECLNAQWFKNT